MGSTHTLRERHNMIRNTMKEAKRKGIEVSYRKLIAQICLDGLSHRTAREDINQFILAGELKLEGDVLSYNKELQDELDIIKSQ